MNDQRFEKLLESIDEMRAHRREDLELPAENIRFVEEPDPREVRDKMGLTQVDFAHVLGVSAKSVQNWEQGLRAPGGAAMKLLQIANDDPDYLMRYA